MELTANEYDRLKLLQTEVLTELIRSKLTWTGSFCASSRAFNV